MGWVSIRKKCGGDNRASVVINHIMPATRIFRLHFVQTLRV